MQVAHVSAAAAASYAITLDGAGYAWGFGENLQLTNGEEEVRGGGMGVGSGRVTGQGGGLC